jgi:hypothetical protein
VVPGQQAAPAAGAPGTLPAAQQQVYQHT